MKTLPDLLRDADPLGYEPRRSVHERLRRRQRILDASRVVEDLPKRRGVLVAIVAITLLGSAAGSHYWSRVVVDAAALDFEVRLAEQSPAIGLREAVISGAGPTIYLHPQPIVTNSDIVRAEVVQGEAASTFSVTVTFNGDGAAKMLRATQNHIGRPLAILVDGQVMMTPVVKSPVSAAATISGNFTRAEADRIVEGIMSR